MFFIDLDNLVIFVIIEKFYEVYFKELNEIIWGYVGLFFNDFRGCFSDI